MTSRKWMPHDYQDEVVSPARPSPNDWILKTDEGLALVADSEFTSADIAGRPLSDGDVVKFDWTEQYGTRELTFHRSEVGWRWDLAGVEPTASLGGDMMVAEVGNWESVMPSLEEFAIEYAANGVEDGEAITLVFYAWSREPVEFTLRAGEFLAAPAVN